MELNITNNDNMNAIIDSFVSPAQVSSTAEYNDKNKYVIYLELNTVIRTDRINSDKPLGLIYQTDSLALTTF